MCAFCKRKDPPQHLPLCLLMYLTQVLSTLRCRRNAANTQSLILRFVLLCFGVFLFVCLGFFGFFFVFWGFFCFFFFFLPFSGNEGTQRCWLGQSDASAQGTNLPPSLAQSRSSVRVSTTQAVPYLRQNCRCINKLTATNSPHPHQLTLSPSPFPSPSRTSTLQRLYLIDS